MDFYRFINSKDIREYHKEINYQYNAAEAAWLVYQCKDANVEEKHAAWQWIIDNMEDWEIAERGNYRTYSSIKTVLRKYMELEDRGVSEFFKNDDNAVYSYSSLYRDESTTEWCKDDCLYSDFETCWNDKEEDEDIVRYQIRKRYLDDSKEIDIEFDLNKKPYIHSLYRNACWDMTEEETDLVCYSFMGLWFDFPTPFRKGDIIWNPDHPSCEHMCSGPFVNNGICLEGIESEKVIDNIRTYGDESDMTAGGYFVYKDGQIYMECTHNYMDMEFYPKKPEGAIRTLIPISNYLKGQISLDLCVRAYHQIMMETMADDAKVVDYLDEGLVLAGLKEEKAVKIWLDDERKAPYDFYHCHSVNEAKSKIRECERYGIEITKISCDHDLGDYANDGGDGIKLIDWLAERETFYPIVIHTMNPVGRDNMQREINRYWPSADGQKNGDERQ
ncbi:MAG: hypothetical protein IJM79_01220 [Erysipelotrichaceae bacterium]|nr:hypothetical protein [Erysipelotrichaceae bacterium]